MTDLAYRDRIRIVEGKAHPRPTSQLPPGAVTLGHQDHDDQPPLLGYKIHKGKPVQGPGRSTDSDRRTGAFPRQFLRVANALDAIGWADPDPQHQPLAGRGEVRTMRRQRQLGHQQLPGAKSTSTTAATASTATDAPKPPPPPSASPASWNAHSSPNYATSAYSNANGSKVKTHTAELDHVRRLLNDLEDERRNSTNWDDEDEQSYRVSKQHYRNRIKTLKTLPQRQAGWETRLTDRTLGVLAREVGNAAGGWVAAECGVAAVVIVGVEPVGEGGAAGGF